MSMSAALTAALMQWEHLQRKRKAVIRQEETLAEALSRLTPGELAEYARMTGEASDGHADAAGAEGNA